MQILMFRHAEKQNAFREDPPLSPRGQAQAQSLVQRFPTGSLPGPILLFSSPKQRAQETLQPLSRAWRMEVKIRPELDERHSPESASQFVERIQQFLRTIESQKDTAQTVVFVSHSDWIAEALILIPAAQDLTHEKYRWWNPAQSMHFDLQEGLWHLREFTKP